MATRGLGTLTLDLIAKTGGFEQGMDRAARTAKQRSSDIQRSVSQIGKAFAAVTAAAVTGLAYFTRQTINTADQISKLSQTTGISTESLSQLGYAADLSGASLEQVATGMNRLARSATDAARGLAAPKRAFDALGISSVNVDGSLKDTDELLLEVSERFSQLEDGAGKAALAQEIFGRSGAALIPFLNQGREGIAAMRQEADEFGLTLSTKAGKEAERFNDNIRRLRAAFDGIIRQFTQAILPTLVQLSEMFVSTAKDSDQLELASRRLEAGFKALVTGGTIIKSVFETLGTVIGGTAAALMSAVRGDFRAAAGILRESFADARSGVTDDIESIVRIWDDASKTIDRDARQLDSALKETLIFGEGDGEATKLQKQADQALETIRKLTEGVQQQIATYDLGAAATIAYRIELGDLAETFATAGAAAEPYKQALIDLTEEYERLQDEAKAAAKEQEEFEQLMARGRSVTESVLTPIEQYQRTIEELNDLLNAGAVAHETYERAVTKAQDRLKEATKEWSVFRDQAMRNTQDIISDTLVSGFDRGAKGIVDSFTKMIDQLVAQAIAARIAEKLFGAEGGASGGGWIGALAALFGGGRQSGGAFSRGRLYRVNEAGVEALRIPGREDYLLSGHQGGEVIPNNRLSGSTGTHVTQNISVQGRVDNRTARQMEIEAARRQRIATARLG